MTAVWQSQMANEADRVEDSGSSATRHFDRLAEVPVVLQRQEPTIHTVRRLLKLRTFCILTERQT